MSQTQNHGKHTSFLHIRGINPKHKAKWVRKANTEAERLNTTDPRGNLSGWVIDTLNHAAAVEPEIPTGTEIRERLQHKLNPRKP